MWIVALLRVDDVRHGPIEIVTFNDCKAVVAHNLIQLLCRFYTQKANLKMFKISALSSNKITKK